MSSPSKPFFSVGIYYSHYECFGHTSRVMVVGEVFKKRFPKGNLFFIQAGIPQPEARLDQLGKVYSLPKAFMDRRHFKEPILGAGENTAERSQACVEIMVQEKLDLLITEFFPLGRAECRHELIPSLARISARGKTLWGVSGYPLLIGLDHEWREKIIKLYQKIIIFSPPMEKELMANTLPHAQDRQKYLDFFERHASKIVFAGYLLPSQGVVGDDENNNLPQPVVPKGACRVTVVRGGGAVYPKLIAEAIRASDLLGKDYHMTVVAGPSTTPQEWYFFATLFAKKKINNLVLLRAVGNYEQLIEACDVSVSMAGYHTSVMLLKHQKKSVIVPFEGYGAKTCHEQPARAEMLKEKIGAQILAVGDLTADSLAAIIQKAALAKPVRTQLPKEWFEGRKALDDILTGLVGP